ncbi:hypothetical protein PPTG_24920 [Phytophthora nicotianae INRA-310]|uniref:Uncharacterized protein n=1 Tax=Phytophthora nicotianae (strain INRA-310) TaxID=761204 RepID=W2PC09_PHYN3|nr:hypothetical protein PPTG_24920 [Phytophthora nicotianae INRA-310]ETM97534.1 hypothetical protein PPTG_24920 [Phytophthora nicotianae INRA-310]
MTVQYTRWRWENTHGSELASVESVDDMESSSRDNSVAVEPPSVGISPGRPGSSI